MRKDGVLDPQGKTIHESLGRLEYDKIESVRVGKVFFIDIKAENAEMAKKQIEEISIKVLSNPIIENFVILDLQEL